MLNTVSFHDDEIRVNSNRVGFLSGARGQTWVHLDAANSTTPVLVMRRAWHKYRAKQLIEFLLQRLTPTELMAKMEVEKKTIFVIAIDLGFVPK